MGSADNRSQTKSLPRGPAGAAEDQRRRLLEALPGAVAKHGYAATTVEQIVSLAQVRRSAFYEQFEGKRDCFGIFYEMAQERLLGALTFHCYSNQGLERRLGAALGAGLELLGNDTALARLLVVEAPAVSEEIAFRHHEWLDRYSRMLRLAAIGGDAPTTPPAAIEPAIVGGIVSRVKQVILAGRAGELPELQPELVQFALSFYGTREVAPAAPAEDDGDSLQPQSPEPGPVLESV